jgi:hypothetical protein
VNRTATRLPRWGELVAVMSRQPNDEAFAFEPAQVVGRLAAGVGLVKQGADEPDQGWVVEPGEQVSEPDDGGHHRHHPWLSEAQCGGVLAVNDARPGHLGEGGHIRSGPGVGCLPISARRSP